jgi:hypothetical protein
MENTLIYDHYKLEELGNIHNIGRDKINFIKYFHLRVN